MTWKYWPLKNVLGEHTILEKFKSRNSRLLVVEAPTGERGFFFIYYGIKRRVVTYGRKQFSLELTKSWHMRDCGHRTQKRKKKKKKFGLAVSLGLTKVNARGFVFWYLIKFKACRQLNHVEEDNSECLEIKGIINNSKNKRLSDY